MSKKAEHINAVIRGFLKSARDKAALTEAFEKVAKEYQVNESTVRDKCTRGLGFTTEEFFAAVNSFLDHKGNELVSRYPPEDVESLYALLSDEVPLQTKTSGGKPPVSEAGDTAQCACGAMLPKRAKFCPSCGAKVMQQAETACPTDRWISRVGRVMESVQEVSEMETCYTAPDGKSAIMNGIVYLLLEQKIYCVDINRGGKLELLLSERDLFEPASYTSKPDADGRIGCISGLKRLACGNGKINFYAACERAPGMRFNDCGDDAHSVRGVFTFQTATRVLSFRPVSRRTSGWAVSQEDAYCIDNNKGMFVALDIATGELEYMPMPKVALADWPDAAKQTKEESVIWEWEPPLIWGGIAYTSVRNAWGYLSICFPVENPGQYTALPYGVCILERETFGRTPVFAPSANTLMLPKGYSDRGRHPSSFQRQPPPRRQAGTPA